jgi:hypothetical protein
MYDENLGIILKNLRKFDILREIVSVLLVDVKFLKIHFNELNSLEKLQEFCTLFFKYRKLGTFQFINEFERIWFGTYLL